MNTVEVLVERGGDRKYVTLDELAAAVKEGWIELGRKITPEVPVKPARGTSGSGPQAGADKPQPEGKGKPGKPAEDGGAKG